MFDCAGVLGALYVKVEDIETNHKEASLTNYEWKNKQVC